MRKYFQITIVLGGFFLLVFLRNLKGGQNEAQPVVGQQPSSILNQPSPTSIPPQNSVPTSSTPPNPPNTPTPSGLYKDGAYTGDPADAYYGYIQVKAIIQNGKISDVAFLQYPSDNRTSVFINSQAMPMLKQEAIRAQSAQVDIISGASDSSMAFAQSLGSALAKAH